MAIGVGRQNRLSSGRFVLSGRSVHRLRSVGVGILITDVMCIGILCTCGFAPLLASIWIHSRSSVPTIAAIIA